MTIATGAPRGPKPKLTVEQHKVLGERYRLHILLRLEAAKHSPHALAQEFGISRTALRDYLDRRPGWQSPSV